MMSECGTYFELMNHLLPTLAYGLLSPLAQGYGRLATGALFLELHRPYCLRTHHDHHRLVLVFQRSVRSRCSVRLKGYGVLVTVMK